MATRRNEFGVESSDSGGFGFSADDDGFEEMFEAATSASVADDEISEPAPSRRSQRAQREEPYAPEEPVRPEAPEPIAQPEQPDEGFDEEEPAELSVEELLRGTAPSETPEDSGYGFSGPEDQPADQPAEAADFSDFGYFQEFDRDSTTEWSDPALDQEYGSDPEPEGTFAPEVWPDPQPSYTPEPEQEQPASFYPEPVEPVAPAPEPAPEPAIAPVAVEVPVVAPAPSVTPSSEDDVDYIERVILTSDAIRDLEDSDSKAVNMFITAGQPVESHQELVSAALRADRQILKTADAILSAKSQTSVDRAFFILGLDESTFVDFGKILSHDLESTETVFFEGDRLQYARRLVDVVDKLPDVSISRFKAVKAVLGAGELAS